MSNLQAADAWSTAHICTALVKLCGDLQDWKALNDNVQLIAKRRAQLKKAIAAAIIEAMTFLDATPDKAAKLELIDTLRAVAAGKVCGVSRLGKRRQPLSNCVSFVIDPFVLEWRRFSSKLSWPALP